VKAGEKKPDGAYPEGTVNFLVDKQLNQYAESLKSFGAAEEVKKEEKDKS
jgi:hypothetical protein